ncbi:MAG: tRNA (adenosine(37)-N6)-dimethylallyltransferase MiaA [Ignavibacteria bacterium]
MNKKLNRTAIAVMGPTASGKTDVAFILAQRLGGEIISADSRQVYKGMPIATAQPSGDQLASVVHHFISILKPDEEFSAGEFAKGSRDIIEECFSKGIVPIIAGGSGLYLRALTDGFYREEIKSPEVRKELNNLLAEKGREHLYELLLRVDPESASKTSANFSRRVFRALEVFYITGRKFSEIQKVNEIPDFETVKFAIDYPRDVLYERINSRVLGMLERGLVDEVRKLMHENYHYTTHNSVNSVGIKEVMMYLEGKSGFDETVSLIQQNSRRFAKRQLTWLRKERDLIWIDVNNVREEDNKTANEQIAEKILALLSL